MHDTVWGYDTWKLSEPPQVPIPGRECSACGEIVKGEDGPHVDETCWECEQGTMLELEPDTGDDW